MIFILAQILPPFLRSCKGNQTYYDKSDQLNQFLCTLNQNETYAFYGRILFGIHLQACLQGLSRESEISKIGPSLNISACCDQLSALALALMGHSNMMLINENPPTYSNNL